MDKTNALKVINRLLKMVGAKIVSYTSDDFHMSAALQRIQSHSFPIKNIIDIGASDGKWSLKAMEIFPDSSFIAIEPLHERESALNALKQQYNNFDYELCVAGADNDKQIALNISEDLDGSTVNGTGGESRLVSVKTIDKIISSRKLQGPHLIKFDTHGYEIPILKGAKDTLRQTNIIVIEVYNFKITENTLRFHKMCSYLEDLGFRCYDIADLMLREYDKSFWQMDLFFCRNESKEFSYPAYK